VIAYKLVGKLHACQCNRTLYDEQRAWSTDRGCWATPSLAWPVIHWLLVLAVVAIAYNLLVGRRAV